MKVRVTKRGNMETKWIYCPACQTLHAIGGGWEWNGSQKKADIGPMSIVIGSYKDKTCCHFYLRDGYIRYLSDSNAHSWGHKYVPLPDIPPRYFPDDVPPYFTEED